jgi:hypothetical protein
VEAVRCPRLTDRTTAAAPPRARGRAVAVGRRRRRLLRGSRSPRDDNEDACFHVRHELHKNGRSHGDGDQFPFSDGGVATATADANDAGEGGGRAPRAS